jgi:hypothetical protein
MKKKVSVIASVVLLLSLALGPAGSAVGAQEPTFEEQIEEAIAKGLDWLASQQNADGSWGSGCDRVARTGLAVLKFETHAIEQGLDPLGDDYEYSSQVADGLTYIMENAHEQAIDVQPAGDPDADGDGIGTYFTDCGFHDIYNTGIAMMALAASGNPGLYGDTLQDAVDYMAWAQADEPCGLHRGGWRYWPDCDSDNSNTGYVTLGLGYAAASPPYGFGLTIPQFVKDELTIWIDVIQDDVDGDTDDGGSWYTPYWSWVNVLKTGNLIYEMGLVGDTPATPRVQDAIDYIERHWYDVGGGISATGWRDHRQAMFTMMKGFEALGITQIDLNNDGVPEHNWFEEVAEHLLDTQNIDGSWPWDPWGDEVLSTAWALLTLERAVPTIEIPVAVDIKPQSCPNPLNVKDKGVVPVAILGTEGFDVGQIDPTSVELEGVSPVTWAWEDVAEPFEPFVGKEDCFADCWAWMPTEEYPEYPGDGYMDLTLKFKAQELVTAVGDVQDGDCLVLHLDGSLKEEFDSTPILGEDVVWIKSKGQ